MREAIQVSIVDLSGLAWRKSSYSGGNGDYGNCVEIAFAEALSWRKSSFSGQNGDNGACVEVAFAGTAVAVRDSKNPAAGALTFPARSFAALLNQ